MNDQPPLFTHVTPKPLAGSLSGKRLVFVHIPKAAGTTFCRILASVAHIRKARKMRISGTVYNQFLGSAKQDTHLGFRAAASDDIENSLFLYGHLPTLYWDERLDPETADFVTVLRDPVSRTISQYRMGVQRQGWAPATPLRDLIARGVFADNLQVRMLAGCKDPSQPCDDAMLKAALDMLRQRFAVIGLSDKFDGFLAALIQLCGWPEIIYEKIHISTTTLESQTLASLRREAAELNAYDRVLVEEVRAAGSPWINWVDPMPAERPAGQSALIASPSVVLPSGAPPLIERHEVDAFAEKVRAHSGTFAVAAD